MFVISTATRRGLGMTTSPCTLLAIDLSDLELRELANAELKGTPFHDS